MLTDRARIDFEVFLKANYDHMLYRFENNKTHLYDLLLADHIKKTDILLNAVIVEWFDSVGIYIDTKFIDFEEGWFCVTVNGKYVDSENGMPINHFSTRQEAIKSAIEKANNLYNENKK